MSELGLCMHSRIGIWGGLSAVSELVGLRSCFGCVCRVVWCMSVLGGLVLWVRCSVASGFERVGVRRCLGS